jgi:hypothetical protein
MSDARNDVILGLLREIRGDTTALVNHQSKLIERIGRLEREVTNLHVDFASVHAATRV